MKTIGKYIVRGLLGRGGMSRVFLAEIPTIHRLVALKQLAPNPALYRLISPTQARNMFIAEAKAMSLLRHRNVADVWDFENTRDHIFYTMEYHPTTLGTLIGEMWRVEEPTRRLPMDTAIDYALQVLAGLSAMHAADIVHRDIKPFNILITADDQVKIGDFGLSRLRGGRFPGPPTLKAGSPYYAAPEQTVDADKADARSDLYATGVMLFRMLTGQLPEHAGHNPAVHNPYLDEAWSAFFRKALHASPRERYASAEQMQNAIIDLADTWQTTKQNICRIDPATDRPELPAFPVPPRHKPVKILETVKAQALFDTNPLWEPRSFHHHPFRPVGETLVEDPTNRLLWQRSGAPHPVSWQDAHHYVAHLNETRFGGREDWRLPTVNEVLTLLSHSPSEKEHFCAPRTFNRRQRNLWTIDRRAYTTAYVVRTDIGFVSWQDLRSVADVRAVCTLNPKTRNPVRR